MTSIPAAKEEETLSLLSVETISKQVNIINERLFDTEQYRKSENEKKNERQSFIERRSLQARRSIINPISNRITATRNIQEEGNRIKEDDVESLYELLRIKESNLMSILDRFLFDWLGAVTNYYIEDRKQKEMQKEKEKIKAKKTWIDAPFGFINDVIKLIYDIIKIIITAVQKNCLTNFLILIFFIFGLIGFIWQLRIGSKELRSFFNSFYHEELIDVIYHFGKR